MNQRRQQPAQQRTENQQISDEQRGQQLFRDVMDGIHRMQGSIEAVLPSHTNFEKFRAIVMMAIRTNPNILSCYGPSIVTACLRAAYDGVMLDNKEAALIPSMNALTDHKGTKFTRRDARYNIMVAGVRKQILAGGQIRDVETAIVYRNEPFKVVRGLHRDLQHEPLPEETRGEPYAAYAVAHWKDGGTPTFEVMYESEINAVRDVAQSGPVWKGKMVLEMWRKTVLRRFRKSLPGGNDVIDMEARADFPEFAGLELDNQANRTAAAPVLNAPAAPRRSDFAQLEQMENGVPVGFGSTGEIQGDELEMVNSSNPDQERETQAAAGRKADSLPAEKGSDQEQQKADPVVADRVEADGEPPEGFETWDAWVGEVSTRLKTASTLNKLEKVVSETRADAQRASKIHRDELAELYELRADDHRAAAQ